MSVLEGLLEAMGHSLISVEKLAEADRKRSGFQDMAAERLITFDELRANLLTSRRPASSPSTSLRSSKDASRACENLTEMRMRC